MENNEEKILNEIEYVLSHDTENKSFLITGSWGIGKTYFFQNELKQRIENNGYIVIEISLLGIKDIFSLKDKILIEYFSKTDKNILSDYFRAFRKKLSSVFDINKIIKNIRDIKESIDSVKEDFGVNLLSKNAFDIIFSDSNEKIFFCFDDCERIADSIFLKEFFSILNSFNHCKNIAFLAIGNMAKFSNEDEFNLYKEKIFFRSFSFEKTENEIVDIILNQYDKTIIPYEKIKNKLIDIIKKEDNYLHKMNDDERRIYDESIDLYSNIRVLTEIVYIINRAFEQLSKNKYVLSEVGIDNVLASFFYFGILFNSSEKIESFNYYREKITAPILLDNEDKKVLYSEILSWHVSFLFTKLETAYDYFNKGYFDEDNFFKEISVYQKSELSSFLETELFLEEERAFNLSFLSDDEKLKKLREYISEELQKDSLKVSKEVINEIITIIIISNIFLGKFQQDDEDKKNLFKHLSYDSIKALEEAIFFDYNNSNAEKCEYVIKFENKYKEYIKELRSMSEEKKEKELSDKLKLLFSNKDYKRIVEIFRYDYDLNEQNLENIFDFVVHEIQNNEFKPHFRDFVNLCKMPRLKQKLLEPLEKFQKDPPEGIRKEFFESLIAQIRSS